MGRWTSTSTSEFIACCVALEVRFVIVGGYAIAAHAHPPYTKDLDVWLWIDQGNAARLVAALADFGFGALGIGPADFAERDAVVQLGCPPHRINLLTSIDGVDFDECWAVRVAVDVGGVPVPFIDAEHLIVNKRASGRAQDLADAEALAGGT